MKTYCKPATTDVENAEFISPAVHCAFIGKLRKRSFQRLLISTGKISKKQLDEDLEVQNMTRIIAAIDAVAEQMADRIRSRNLQLPPVRQFTRIDGLSGKTRNLCQESAEQQVLEYIVKFALDPLFRAKILPCQCGSIPGKGQMGAMRQIQRMMRRTHQTGQMVAIQCDVRQAYPSTRVDMIMGLLHRDIGKNKTLLWLVEAVMSNYPNGCLLIGGFLSAWLFNYVMSYVIRHLTAQAKIRRGKRLPMVCGIVSYADDFVAFGHASNLERAIKRTSRWASGTLGLEIKAAWRVIRLASFDDEKRMKALRGDGSCHRTPGVDMVGFVVRPTYTIVRKRIFKRIRRQVIRASRNLDQLGYVPWWRAQKIIAGWGWLKASDSRKFCKKYRINQILKASRASVSWHTRIGAAYA